MSTYDSILFSYLVCFLLLTHVAYLDKMNELTVAEKKTLMAEAKAHMGLNQPVHCTNPAEIQTWVVKQKINANGNLVKSIPVVGQANLGISRTSLAKKCKQENFWLRPFDLYLLGNWRPPWKKGTCNTKIKFQMLNILITLINIKFR